MSDNPGRPRQLAPAGYGYAWYNELGLRCLTGAFDDVLDQRGRFADPVSEFISLATKAASHESNVATTPIRDRVVTGGFNRHAKEPERLVLDWTRADSYRTYSQHMAECLRSSGSSPTKAAAHLRSGTLSADPSSGKKQVRKGRTVSGA